MKFRQLHCLMFAIACVVGTRVVSVSAAEIIQDPGADIILEPGSGQEGGGGSSSGESGIVFNGNSFKLGELTLCLPSQYLYQGECLECNSNNDKGLQLYLEDGTCRKCPAGTTANSDNTGCVCINGKEWNGSTCECPVSRYLHNGNCVECNTGSGLQLYLEDGSCKKCPAGTVSNQSYTGCECSDGTHWNGSTCVSCGLGQYWSNSYCVQCPEIFDSSGLYSFIKGSDDSGVRSCTVKLNVEKSHCNTGTNAVFTYDDTKMFYVPDVNVYTCTPDSGFVCLYDSAEIANMDPELFYDEGENLKDMCGSGCLPGYYIDSVEKKCKPCPLEGTNAAGYVGENSDYNFVKYGDGKGKRSCAVKLQSYKSCANSTYVLYVYNTAQNKYIRTREDVYPTEYSVINKNKWPAENNLQLDGSGTEFCTSCGETPRLRVDSNGQQIPFNEQDYGTPFNIENKCTSCGKPGFYIQIQELDDNAAIYVCSVCPAGNYCPGSVNDPETSRKAIRCSKDTYSEEGASKCLSCAPGYSTAQSGPVEKGYDGLCLEHVNDDGIGCISSDACKLTMSLLSVGGSDPHTFSLGDNVKIESVNKSVIKSFSYENPAIMAVERPVDSDFWDEE